MLIGECLTQAAATLELAGIESWRLEARVLLCHVLGCQTSYLLAHGDEELPPDPCLRYLTCIARRAGGMPLAYITGSREFYALSFRVDSHTLIPRADTETLVEAALELDGRCHFRDILELGTGSGAVIIVLATRLPRARCTATDISLPALDVARRNAADHGVDVEFVAGSWFEPLSGRRFELIVANPPYVREDDEHLAALQHEPAVALLGGEDGLRELRCIIRQAPQHLCPGGVLLTEHGWDQGRAVRGLFAGSGYHDIRTLRDLQGRERVTMGVTGERVHA